MVALVCVAAAGCAARESTEIVVVVDNVGLGALRMISLEAHREDEAVAARSVIMGDAAADGPRPSFPLRFTLVHEGGSMGPIELRVRAFKDGNHLALERRARVSFVADTTKMLRMDLYADCQQLDCQARNETCGAGGCESWEADGRLRDYEEPPGAAPAFRMSLPPPDNDAGPAIRETQDAARDRPDAAAVDVGDDTPPDAAPPVDPRAVPCPAFPTGGERFRKDVSEEPVDVRSDKYLAFLKASSSTLRVGFGTGTRPGIPWIAVPKNQASVRVETTLGIGGQWMLPFPLDAPIEAGPGAHIVVVTDACALHEAWGCSRDGDGFLCKSQGKWSLSTYFATVAGLPSGDASGLPLFPLMLRANELRAGKVEHALRLTLSNAARAYVAPAIASAGTLADADAPPLGITLRLKRSFDEASFSPASRAVVAAMKTYGLIFSGLGDDWAITGETSDLWPAELLEELATIPASGFEVVAHGTPKPGS